MDMYPPTAADWAQVSADRAKGMAQSNEAAIFSLTERVETLERRLGVLADVTAALLGALRRATADDL
jgi:hypothetical protein